MERELHAACCLNYNDKHPQLLVTGGLDNNENALKDAWILDVNSGKWKEVREVEGVYDQTNYQSNQNGIPVNYDVMMFPN